MGGLAYRALGHCPNLESLMLIAVEKETAVQLKKDKEKIIDRLAATSKELTSLLLV